YLFFISGNSIQKKWKNMKDCFTKELATQQGKSGQAATPKKKKYRHFDSMLFLIPSMQKRETSSNVLSPVCTPNINVTSPVSTQDITLTAPVGHSHPTRKYTKSVRKKTCYEDNNSREYENQLLDILKGKQQQDDDDEEKNFALMLVPMLRKLNDDQKHYAKIEILNVLKKARSHSSPQTHVLSQPFREPRMSCPPSYQINTQPQNTYQYSPQSSSLDTLYYIQSPPSTLPPSDPSPQPSTTILQAPLTSASQNQVQIMHQEVINPANATANYFAQFGNQLIEERNYADESII
ncbi:uncharacterized protein, partial [Epargyreus clarus]|uniref:uncharacterized protein n=2 Tax=Epargyreus clarus TaxID=520877 RepID=UPI003C309F4C